MCRSKIIAFLLIFTTVLDAQQVSKTDFSLVKKMRSYSSDQSLKKEEKVKVLVKGEINEIKSIVTSNGGHFNYSAGDVASVTLPLNQIYLLVQNPLVKRIEMGSRKVKPFNDTAAVKNNILPIHNGQTPLTQDYDGRGVVIGFIDTGIDFTHPDFLDSLGKSRVKYLWDQNLSVAANTPQPYGYGQEWNNTEIDAGMASAHNDLASFGHGTHVAGAGAGNGSAVGKYKGVAPNADMIMVALDFNYNTTQPTADAVEYIYSKAEELGKPCVINASVGGYFGSHDGKDLEAQLIDNLIKAQKGRALVASAGNIGDFNIHLSYNVSNDSLFTWMYNNGNAIYMEVWGDSAAFKDVQFTIGADAVNPVYSYRGHLPFSSIQDHIGVYLVDTLKKNGNILGIIESYGDFSEGTYSMQFLITPDSTNYYWRFITTGSGDFDSWSYCFVADNLPTAATFPDITRYKMPDTDQSIASSFQCLSSVITVGNYYNAKSWYDYTNALHTDPVAVADDIVPSSSHGPTRDGRIKPDIAATGDNIISCGVLAQMPDWIMYNPQKVGIGSKHIIGGGTSAASPIVAGAVALFLQKNPNATWQQIKNAILQTAKQDVFTGSALPNNTWGYGKLNGFGEMMMCGTSLPAVTISGSLSVCKGQSTILTTSGADLYSWKPATDLKPITADSSIVELTPTTTTNYSLTAFQNNCDTTIVFTILVEDCSTAINNEPHIEKLIQVFPNPFTDKVFLQYDLSAFGDLLIQMEISDALGKRIKTIELKQKKANVLLLDNVKSGIYFYRLVVNNETITKGKLISIAK